MNLIVNVDKNWGIGLGNKLLVRIPQDMKFFREMTKGKVVVMGRKTLESFPGGQPLADRLNIVLTTDKNYKAERAVLVHSPEELAGELDKYASGDVFIIGGGSVYRQMLPHCDKAYVTKVDHSFDADTYFPDLDHEPGWRITKVRDEQTYFDLIYEFTIYERQS